jgi:hypothetical protein
MITIQGTEFKQVTIRDSYDRRALQYKNKIISNLKNFGLIEDDIEVPLEKITFRKAQALASWYMYDQHLFFSYNGSQKFVENLAMVAQVIEHFLNRLKNEEITQEDFLKLFNEDCDILEQRKKAREVLGVEENSLDFQAMHKKYKELSKTHHPDMPNGNTETFQNINHAHKVLRKELHET